LPLERLRPIGLKYVPAWTTGPGPHESAGHQHFSSSGHLPTPASLAQVSFARVA
jgi:hypothetical protein